MNEIKTLNEEHKRQLESLMEEYPANKKSVKVVISLFMFHLSFGRPTSSGTVGNILLGWAQTCPDV